MSYFADHLAWQQRVAQEFKAQSSHLDTQMYQANGQWFNYPDLVNYLKTTNGKKGMGQANMSRGFGSHGDQGIVQPGSVPAMYGGVMSPKSRQGDDTKSNYGYAPKSKLLYQRQSAQGKTSRTGNKYASRQMGREQLGPYTGAEETESQLNRENMKRFNESYVDQAGPKSLKSRSVYSKPRSVVGSRAGRSMLSATQKQKKKMEIYQNVEKLDDLQIDQISAIISTQKPKAEEEQVDPAETQDVVADLPEVAVGEEEDKLTSITQKQMKPTPSQISGMSGRTYISSLQAQLQEEKDARQNLEAELQELKKISSEITSQLSAIQKQDQQKQ